MKSKGGGQGLYRNAVDHIKNFDNDDLQVPQCFVAWVMIMIMIMIKDTEKYSYKLIYSGRLQQIKIRLNYLEKLPEIGTL